MVLADLHDYQKGFNVHYDGYKKLYIENHAERSRLLLLVYSVECGLKYKLLKKWCITNPKVIYENEDDRRNKIIKSHNLDLILKELGLAGSFRFQRIKTKHGENITIKEFHELCRYGIRFEEQDYEKLNSFEIELSKIAEWIKEVM